MFILDYINVFFSRLDCVYGVQSKVLMLCLKNITLFFTQLIFCSFSDDFLVL